MTTDLLRDRTLLVSCNRIVTLQGYAGRLFAPIPRVMRRSLRITSLVVSTLLPGLFNSASAQPTAAYPVKTIKLVVPFPPGAGTDAIARLIAQKLAESMAATIIVENRVGAGGAIG